MKSTEQLLQPRVEEDTDSFLPDEDENAANTVACYYWNGSDGIDGAENSENKDGDEGNNSGISYDDRLGLAIETLQTGVTTDQLWRVI